MQWIYIILSAVCNLVGAEETRPLVSTPMGTVRGSFYQSVGSRQYAAFEGIPYAKPPVKKNRFREPRPVKQWEGVLEARFKHTCIQYNHYISVDQDRVIGDEDCLYLNVYTPNLQPETALDVVVFIHGGAFMYGSGHVYGERILMDSDVVYVTMNYRLGPFGFLSTEDNIVPGNNGMKDQVLALKWIKSHIQHFGGNPESITITGMSAGGVSVHLHYMSPLTRGLFKRGFSMSGTALNPWALQENPLEKAKKLAAILECDTENIRAMINCLSHIPARIVVQAMEHFFGYLYNPFSPFGVVVEPKTAANAFLNQHPYELLRSGDIQDLSWITSIVQSEGLYPAAEFVSDAKYLPEIESRWTELAPYILDYNYTADCAQKSVIAEKAREYYLKGNAISRDTYDQLVQMIGDRLFNADAAMAAQLQAGTTTSDVYFYRFTYRGAHSKSEGLSKCNENFGASHGDDTVYVLSSNVDTTTTDQDRQMTETLVDVWLSYAKDGIPLLKNKPWTRVSPEPQAPLNYVEIQSPSSFLEKSDTNFGNSAFWHSLALKENQNLFANTKEEL